MISLNLDSILKYLKEQGYEAILQEETHQVYYIIKIAEKEFPLFIRIFDKSNLLQILAFMPSHIKSGTQNDVGRLLHLINKELDIPGFGMDEANNVIFYRLMLPCPDKKIQTNLLDSFLKSTEMVCEKLSAPVIAVSAGLITYEEVLKKTEQDKQAQTIKV